MARHKSSYYMKLASLDVQMDRRAEDLGKRFRYGLHTIRSNEIKEIRGVGLLDAIEIGKSAGAARKHTGQLMKLGILAKDTHGQTIRFAPPLVIREREVDWIVGIVRKVLE